MKYNTTIIIPIGLPGSGKTYYTNKMRDEKGAEGIDFDYYFQWVKPTGKTVEEYFKSYFISAWDHSWWDEKYIILDGPWFTANAVKQIVSEITAILNKSLESWTGYSFKLVHFNENREACLNNDNGRREVSSKVTIKNMPYLSKITDEFINELKNIKDMKATNIEVEEKEVYRVSAWERALDKVFGITLKDAERNPYFSSETWSNGGTWRDCWGNEGRCSAEAPLEFEKFDEFLEEVCPNITFLQYKNIKSKCVSLETVNDSDYYGGHTSESYWECNLNNLKKCLIEKGLMED